MATAPASVEQPNLPLFEIREIPGKGRGLVARMNIATGTRILCEKPLLTVRSTDADLEHVLAAKLKQLSRESQRQYLTLRNHNPEIYPYPFSGIFQTNAVPCGPNTTLAGVYPTICLINHSCVPNAHQCWNGDKEWETIHANRPIAAGEEITFGYDIALRISDARRAFLKGKYNFDCKCPACSLPPARLKTSEERRTEIEILDTDVAAFSGLETRPHDRLRDCYLVLKSTRAAFGDSIHFWTARTYHDALQVCIAHGDEARAGVFAERAYEVSLICSGEDHPETQLMKSYARNPASHPVFKRVSSNWKTKKTLVPKGLDSEQFEDWLFRLKGI